jgi:hypothetical protein
MSDKEVCQSYHARVLMGACQNCGGSYERHVEVQVVHVTKAELDGLREYAPKMQAVLAKLKDSYVELSSPGSGKALADLCIASAKLIAEQEMKGLIKVKLKQENGA